MRGYKIGSSICLVQTGVMLIMMGIFYKRASLQQQRMFTHLFIGSSSVVVFAVAACHPEIAIALFFLPLGIIMAAQVLGVRGAFPWLIFNLVAFGVYPWINREASSGLSITEFDCLFVSFGIGLATFLSCWQSETLFHRRTGALVGLSRELRALATTDSLTGLMNRHQFQTKLEMQLSEVKSPQFALLLIDMDGFKGINDTLGHPVGDDTLIEIASRLQQTVGTDHVFRLGGDEFCVLLPNASSPESANATARSIQQSLCQPYELKDTEFNLGASIGVANFPVDATTSHELLSFADTAMYHAKQFQLGICNYDAELTDHLNETRRTQNRLSVALEREEFFLLYQPQIDLKTGKVVAVEALLRWKFGQEVISPGVFIPVLEKSRLIIPVGRWVIREACRQLKEWSDAGFDLCISVNVSAVQFQDQGFVQSVYDSIEEFGVDAAKLDFEITEGVFIENFDEVVSRLYQLRELGSTISIDDFGTGYSSLAYLRQLPLNKLKIDRAFVKGIGEGDDGTLASSITALAKTLDLKTTAEGVETRHQLKFLEELECDVYQGFYHSRPLSVDEVTQYFESKPIVQSQSLLLEK